MLISYMPAFLIGIFNIMRQLQSFQINLFFKVYLCGLLQNTEIPFFLHVYTFIFAENL